MARGEVPLLDVRWPDVNACRVPHMIMRLGARAVPREGARMHPFTSSSLAAAFVLSAAACIYTPTDDSVVGGMRPDGQRSAVTLSGFGTAPGDTVKLQALDHTTGSWVELAAVETDAAELGDTDLFPWSVRHARLRDPRLFAPGTLPDGTGAGHYMRIRGRYGDTGANMLTFDEDGQKCIDRALAAGSTAASAGQKCATGKDLTLWWSSAPPRRGEDLQLESTSYPCAAPHILTASPEEADHLATTRFTPPTYPYAVETMTYVMIHDPEPTDGRSYGCDAGMTHEVRFYRSSDRTPSAAPELVATRTVTEPRPTRPSEHFTTVRLDTPVVLEAGEHLFAAVQFPRVADQGVCIEACALGAAYEPGRHFWSYAAAPPFAWREFLTFGGDWATLIWIDGYAIEAE